jgi:hypothetical protein
VGVPILDYSPMEHLRCGSRVCTQSTVNPTANFTRVPGAPIALRADRREVGGIREAAGQHSRRGWIALFSTSVEGSCGNAPLRCSSRFSASHVQRQEAIEDITRIDPPVSPTQLRQVLEDDPQFSSERQQRAPGKPTAATRNPRLRKNGNWTDKQLNAAIGLTCSSTRPLQLMMKE